MSIETKADAEYHMISVAAGLSGLRLKKEFEKSDIPELTQFQNYLNKVKSITLPSGFSEEQKTINDALDNVKKNIERDDTVNAINCAQSLFHNLEIVYEKINMIGYF